MAKVDLVINFDDPFEMESYFHRIGRTARFGRFGASFLMMTEQKFSKFTENNQYTFRIAKLSSADQFEQAVNQINTKLSDLRQQTDPAEEDKKLQLERALRTMGTESLIGAWSATGDLKASRYEDIGQYKYVTEKFEISLADGMMMEESLQESGDEEAVLDDEQASDDSCSEKIEIKQVEDRSQRSVSFGERGGEFLGKKTQIAQLNDGTLSFGAEPQKQIKSNIISSDEEIPLAKQSQDLSFDVFNRLFDLLCDKKLRNIVKITSQHCDIDFKSLELIEAIERL